MNDKSKIIIPVNGKTPELGKDMSLKHAALISFSYYFRNMGWNEKGILQNKDPEFLHYMRVSSKRLRVAMSIFRPYFRKSEINYFKNEVKTLAPVLGAARDIDVYLDFLKEEILPKMSPAERRSLEGYIGFFKEMRIQLQAPVVEKINSARYQKFKNRFARFLEKGLASNKHAKYSRLSRIAKLEIERDIESLLKSARRLSRKSCDHRLHKFRIKCRKTRYRTELFLNLLGESGQKTAKKLVAIQNALGGQHDSITAGEKLDHFLKLHPQFRRTTVLRKLRKIQKCRAIRFKRKFFRKIARIKEISGLL